MKTTLIGVAALSCAAAANAQNLSVTFENLLPQDGPAFSPVFQGLSDGTFNLFDAGEPASAGLEDLAELGSTDTLETEFATTDPLGQSAATTGGPITGGESVTTNFNVGSPIQSRFFSFASMVVPSNDLFVGNPEQVELFNAGGDFTGPLTIELFGDDVWDAGTEVNDADNGPAFLEGADAMAGAEEGGTIEPFIGSLGYLDYLDDLEGRTTAAGFDLASTFAQETPIARITIVPAPGVAAIAPLGLAAMTRRRR